MGLVSGEINDSFVINFTSVGLTAYRLDQLLLLLVMLASSMELCLFTLVPLAISAVLAVIRRLSVCHVGGLYVSTWLKISSNFLFSPVNPSF